MKCWLYSKVIVPWSNLWILGLIRSASIWNLWVITLHKNLDQRCTCNQGGNVVWKQTCFVPKDEAYFDSNHSTPKLIKFVQPTVLFLRHVVLGTLYKLTATRCIRNNWFDNVLSALHLLQRWTANVVWLLEPPWQVMALMHFYCLALSQLSLNTIAMLILIL